MGVFSENAIIGASAIAGGYDIDQSLRVDDGDSANLSRTPSSASNRKTWTWSGWVKRGNLATGSNQCFFSAGADGSNFQNLAFNTSDALFFDHYESNVLKGRRTSTALYRDTSAWYHIVVAYDTTQSTASDRIKIYVNGEVVSDFSSTTDPALNHDGIVNNTVEHRHFSIGYGAYWLFDGYLAEVNFIDGQALTPASFGETNSDTNQWVPIEVTGMTYGTNGFYQKYSSTELANSFTDSTKYTVQSFTSTGSTTWTAPTGVTSVEYLVVAGGGAGGGGYYGGGGGAGGMRTGSLSVTPGTSYTVTVGAGGAATSSSNTNGSNGSDSVFSSITSNGGGGGGAYQQTTPTGGGSGGGGGRGGNGAAGTSGQGNAGGNGNGGASSGGGGGGGAGAVGGAGAGSGGSGGVGLQSNITGTNTYYAGGGGGGSYNQNNFNNGGQGGGGTGNFDNPAGSGTANTGGGGGGASVGGNASGAGGSGIVIVRYLSTTGTVSRHTITANGDVANVRTPFYKSESFTTVASTTWTAPAGITSVEYLVVAGGGEGGWDAGGGGGAGGYRTGTLSVTPGASYTVTVGAGGTSTQSGSSKYGADGANSVFSSITSTGGGGAGSTSTSISGRAGGSGGGGGGYNASGGSGGAGNAGSFSPVEGYAGGAGASGVTHAGGGGGGSSGAGATGGSPTSAGGAGTSNSITGSAVTYAAGGQGNSDSGGSNTSGAANTGNGGNGGAGTPQGGAGGSGIVVIKYLDHDHPIESSSIKFDGTGDYLNAGSSTDWDFGSGDFTLECWARASALPDQPRLFGDSGGNWFFRIGDVGSDKVISAYNGNWFGNNSQGTVSVGTWYHFAWSRESGTNRFFFNGNLITAATITDASISTTNLYIGGGVSSQDLDGYMDEIRISNSARYTANFTPSTTAFTADANTLLLIHSDFNGGLGSDSSGNQNDFNITNITVSDQVLDSPTNNFATLNPLWMSRSNDSSRTFAEGNLKAATAATNWKNLVTTHNISSGKWYWECVPFGGNFNWQVGVCRTDWNTGGTNVGPETTGSYCIYCSGASSGGTWDNGSYSALNRDVWAANDILMVAYDDDTGKFWLGKNGTWFNSGNPSSGSTPLFTVVAADRGDIYPIFAYHTDTAGYYINTGADSSFSGQKTAQGNSDGNSKGDFYYTPPSGFIALCTDNLDNPSIADPTAHFNTVLYAGNGGTQSVTGAGFAPDFVWIKNRTDAVNHGLFDTIRGVKNSLQSNTNTEARTAAGATEDLYAFGSDGFSVGVGGGAYINCNESSKNYASWNWKAGGTASSNSDGTITSSVSANPTAGFSIASYTGNATTGATVGHGLSQAPEMLIVKQRDAVKHWSVLANSDPTDYLILNSDNATADDIGFWNDTNPSSSVFTLGSIDWVNDNTNTYIAYCFHSVDGYSKVGSYVGNDSPNGPFITTGFRPAFLMLKAKDRGDDWIIVDNKRDSYNILTRKLNPNTNGAEITNHAIVDFVSNGFKIRDNSDKVNLLNSNYFYLAFAESPFKYSNAR